MRAELRRPPPVGVRSAVVLSLLAAGVVSFFRLGLTWEQLVPGRDAFRQMGAFLAAAFTPALVNEAGAPPGTPPLLRQALDAAALTVVFATTALSVALVLGVGLGFLASSVWWSGERATARSPAARLFARVVAPAMLAAARTLIAVMRSIHELVWAILLLCALGLNDLAAVVAIAIPFGGTLAKVFSEMLDEAPRDSADALRGAGASRTQVFLFGLLPRALPDMAAYTLYRYECALRSSAILGFFGWRTLGYFIKQQWDVADYPEVWTYLYTLLALVLLVEWWSGQIRRRFVA